MRLLPLLLLPLAHGHQPATADADVDIADPYISYAMTGSFDRGDEVFSFRLDYDRGFALPFELLTEKRAGQEEFRPMYAVVGPGLPLPDEATRVALPKSPAEGLGVFLDRNDDPERLVVFESVMRRFYWSSEATALALDPGVYELWVWSPEGDTGDFVLGFGVEEDFSGGYGALFEEWTSYAY